MLDRQGRLIEAPQLQALPGGASADLLFCPFTAPFHAILPVPTISIVHDLQFAAYPQFFAKADIAERARHFSDAVAICDRLICVSDYVANEVRRVARLNHRRVGFVHNAIADRLPAVTPQDATAVLDRLGLVAGRYLLYPANTWPHKNHAMLITAVGQYFAAHPDSDLKLVCAGVSDDPRGRALREAVVRMGLAQRVLFPGFQDEPAFAALLSSARALIFPSLFEGFGIPVLEAMAMGVPVLSADTTSLPEICGEAALMFDPRRPHDIVRAIEAIETDPGLAVRLAAAGRVQARTIGTAETMAARYLAIFAEVCKERRRLRGQIGWRTLVMRRRAVRLARWLFGRVQLVRAAAGRRLPAVRALVNRIRGLLSGTSRS